MGVGGAMARGGLRGLAVDEVSIETESGMPDTRIRWIGSRLGLLPFYSMKACSMHDLCDLSKADTGDRLKLRRPHSTCHGVHCDSTDSALLESWELMIRFWYNRPP